jgi:hypothetical protein
VTVRAIKRQKERNREEDGVESERDGGGGGERERDRERLRAMPLMDSKEIILLVPILKSRIIY